MIDVAHKTYSLFSAIIKKARKKIKETDDNTQRWISMIKNNNYETLTTIYLKTYQQSSTDENFITKTSKMLLLYIFVSIDNKFANRIIKKHNLNFTPRSRIYENSLFPPQSDMMGLPKVFSDSINPTEEYKKITSYIEELYEEVTDYVTTQLTKTGEKNITPEDLMNIYLIAYNNFQNRNDPSASDHSYDTTVIQAIIDKENEHIDLLTNAGESKKFRIDIFIIIIIFLFTSLAIFVVISIVIAFVMSFYDNRFKNKTLYAKIKNSLNYGPFYVLYRSYELIRIKINKRKSFSRN